MGQIQTNWISFWKDLSNDDGFQRIKIKEKNAAIGLNHPISEFSSCRKTRASSEVEVIDINKLSTADAIVEDVVNENLSLETSLTGPDKENFNWNEVKIISKRNSNIALKSQIGDRKHRGRGKDIHESWIANNFSILTPNCIRMRMPNMNSY